jgi:hypothetical protein
MLIFSVSFFYIVLIAFSCMEFSKMSHNITFGMDVAGGGWGGCGVLGEASGVLLSQAAESRVEGQQKECFKLKYSLSVIYSVYISEMNVRKINKCGFVLKVHNSIAGIHCNYSPWAPFHLVTPLN